MKEKPKKENKTRKSKVYPNPTIAEALCEIHFSSSEKYNQKNIEKLKNLLENTYPDVNEEKVKHYRAIIEENGLVVKEESSQRTIFKHRERNHLIQVYPEVLTVNEIGKYPSWEVFIEDIKCGYVALDKIFVIANLNRIGLRYINLIPRKNRDEALIDWLKPSKYYPDGILNNTTGFISRCEFNLKDNKKLIVTLSESLHEENLGSIIFDIDVLSTDFKKTEYDFLINHLNSLHDIASEVFHDSISKKYKAILEGE